MTESEQLLRLAQGLRLIRDSTSGYAQNVATRALDEAGVDDPPEDMVPAYETHMHTDVHIAGKHYQVVSMTLGNEPSGAVRPSAGAGADLTGGQGRDAGSPATFGRWSGRPPSSGTPLVATSATARLTPLMRSALEQAHAHGELRRTHENKPGQPAWPCSPNTLRALVNHRLLEQSERKNRHGELMDIWKITDTGREALNPPTRAARDTVHLMRVQGPARHRLMIGGVWTNVSAPEPEQLSNSEWGKLDHLPARVRHEEAHPTRRRRAA